jgi:NAD(P)-dependent dehydrogenase (short-subunit alcohol dehydrogenase family)
MKDFKDKVVVITGAGSGIGRALALDFHQRGARLALNDFNEQGLSETVGLIDREVFTEVFDVSKKEAMFAFADSVANHYGQVDVVINNAGVALVKGTTSEVTVEEYEWVLGINLWGMMYGSLAFLPHLRRQTESSLVNVSSIFGIHGIPGQTAYCTSKFGIRGFTESLVIEEKLNKSNVHVATVHPGGIKTNIARTAMQIENASEEDIVKIEKAFITTPAKAAKRIINGITRQKNRIIVGPDGMYLYLLTKLPHFISIWFIKRWGKELI